MKLKIVSFLFSLSLPLITHSQDIELFTGQSSEIDSNKPKVLILFDTSSSMGNYLDVKKPFDATKNYAALGSNTSIGDRLYFRKASASSIKVDQEGENRYIPADINGCHQAKLSIDDVGFYTGYVRQYSFQGSTGAWRELPNTDGSSIQLIDCLDDMTVADSVNGQVRGSSHTLDPGFPVDGEGSIDSPQYYTSATDSDAALQASADTYFGSGELVTLYSERYLRWLDGIPLPADIISKSRVNVAKEAMDALITSNTNVDFALQIFNSNNEGGRIVNGFVDGNGATRTALITRIKNLQIGGSTPLCESLYEASLYLGGKSYKYGQYVDDENEDSIAFDPDIFRGNKYKTPFEGCNKQIFVIVVTDGGPTVDYDANSDIIALGGVGPVTTFTDEYGYSGNKTYLPALAHWMHTHDLLTGKTVQQTDPQARTDDYSKINNATIYTVGFALNDDEPVTGGELGLVDLLRLTASNGGGGFYSADNPSSLLASLQSILNRILVTPASVTAPAIASNSFDRTQTLDAVYYSMFLPSEGPRWQGNIKKYKATSNGIVDRLGKNAIDSDGNINANASSFWSSGGPDGGSIESGGVAEMLKGVSKRNILSDLNLITGKAALLPLTKKNMKSGLKLNTNLELATYFGVPLNQLNNTLNWIKGRDVDDTDNDNDIVENRDDVFGDPIHSKPIVINYGGSKDKPTLRLFVGTNQGMLHSFDDDGDSVTEAWAFLPQNFYKNISPLRQNIPSSQKIYGVDGPMTAYVTDVNNTGSVGSKDKAWLFFGLRRGGSIYYALDVTKKNKPKLMWKIKAAGDFSGMGQTWSKPKIAFSKLNVENGKAKPVLIFGGGYSTLKDSKSRTNGKDKIGVGIYMVDAETGKLIWRLHAKNNGKTTLFSGVDSIPSSIATLDSDGDGYVDRLYTGDTGGNVWRIDIPSSAIKDISVIKLASLGSADEGEHDNDRRFFSAPTVVRALLTQTVETTVEDKNGHKKTVIDRFEKPFDAVLIGSGDITNPLATNNDDAFFMIKDENIITQKFSITNAPDVITFSDLMDYTDNPFEGLNKKKKNKKSIEASKKSGWVNSFTARNGEKSMSSAAVIAGVAYFNSFSPSSADNGESCSIGSGESALYAIDLALGTKVYDYRRIITGYNPPGEPTIVSVDHKLKLGEDKKTAPKKDLVLIAPNIKPLCDGSNCNDDSLQTKTIRTYLYVEEN